MSRYMSPIGEDEISSHKVSSHPLKRPDSICARMEAYITHPHEADKDWEHLHITTKF